MSNCFGSFLEGYTNAEIERDWISREICYQVYGDLGIHTFKFRFSSIQTVCLVLFRATLNLKAEETTHLRAHPPTLHFG